MNRNRIYHEKVEIKADRIKEFYDSRAKLAADMECVYTSVLLGDQDPGYAQKWDAVEKEQILPLLRVDETSSVLDIGCGIGRWAETLIPRCGNYVGIDFSEEMIRIARERNNFPSRNYRFYVSSFQDFAAGKMGVENVSFDRVLIGGVCMYINDGELSDCFCHLIRFLKDRCLIFLTETVATEQRLTLNEFPSEALKSNYDVIYRTPQEYEQLYQHLDKAGFSAAEQGYFPHLNKESSYGETERWYVLLQRWKESYES